MATIVVGIRKTDVLFGNVNTQYWGWWTYMRVETDTVPVGKRGAFNVVEEVVDEWGFAVRHHRPYVSG